MKYGLLVLLTLTLASCAVSTAQQPLPGKVDYPDLGVAPELVGDTWLNTASPLRLSDLRGKVVLLDIWTFG